MIAILICLIISLIVRIAAGELAVKFDFLAAWLPYLTGMVIVFAVASAVAVVITVIKMTKK